MSFKDRVVIVTGQGPFEAPEASRRLSEILTHMQVPHWLDVWGHDVSHQWPWWCRQLQHHGIWRAGVSPPGDDRDLLEHREFRVGKSRDAHALEVLGEISGDAMERVVRDDESNHTTNCNRRPPPPPPIDLEPAIIGWIH